MAGETTARGLIVKDNEFAPSGGQKPSPDGVCPQCGAKATPWRPPMRDHRYKQRVAQIREVQRLDSDAEAHKRYMREAGGYIHACGKCGTPFFVPAYVAEIGEEE